MKRDYFIKILSGALQLSPSTLFGREVALIRGGFADYLRSLGYAPFTIEHYLRRLARVSHWLCEHHRRITLSNLTHKAVVKILHDCLPGRQFDTVINYRKVLFHWLRFHGHHVKPGDRPPWQPWIDQYVEFLRSHRGVGAATIEHGVSNAKAFLHWQFGHGPADWHQIKVRDIWDFAHEHTSGVRPIYAKAQLGHVKRFLSFIHLHGACSEDLVHAVPKIAVRGCSLPPQTLSDRQQRTLRTSFVRSTPEGKRDYAMVLCMLDLGMRSSEVIHLRLPDINWRERWFCVPATKTGRGREMPIPKHVFEALRDYVENGRPTEQSFDHVFVRHPRRIGQPLSRGALKAMVARAYRRCGFPKSWSGTHRLRHTFATRLHQRGLDLKPIADLLGHRRLDSTNDYVQVDLEGMRTLAQPWPLPS